MRNYSKRCLLGLMFVVVLQYQGAVGEESSQELLKEKGQVEVLGKTKELPLKELRVFTEVVQIIQSVYYDKIDTETLLNYAIKGMVSELDPHSSYLKASEFQDLEISTSGQYGGIGIEATVENGLVRVVSPIDDTPAALAGILPGDLIVKINGASVKGMSLTDAVEKMRGKVGESVKLSVLRVNQVGIIDITIKRAVIKVQSVKLKPLGKGYSYIRVSQFQSDTDKELVSMINKLKAQEGGLHGIILDLRNNPGGVLQSAVGVADIFIEKGLIVYTEGRVPTDSLIFHAKKEGTVIDLPLVVLINGGSASASEIVAGAIQDHRRGVIMGEKTFGKGSVQTIRSLSAASDRGIKLTTALYYTPLGRSIQAKGIVPDIFVSQGKMVSENDSKKSGYKESDLLHHIGNDKAKQSKQSQKKNKAHKKGTVDAQNLRESEEAVSKLLSEDFQLHQALTVLKGMVVQASVKRENPKVKMKKMKQ